MTLLDFSFELGRVFEHVASIIDPCQAHLSS